MLGTVGSEGDVKTETGTTNHCSHGLLQFFEFFLGFSEILRPFFSWLWDLYILVDGFLVGEKKLSFVDG